MVRSWTTGAGGRCRSQTAKPKCNYWCRIRSGGSSKASHPDDRTIVGSVDPADETTKASGECQQFRAVRDSGN